MSLVEKYFTVLFLGLIMKWPDRVAQWRLPSINCYQIFYVNVLATIAFIRMVHANAQHMETHNTFNISQWSCQYKLTMQILITFRWRASLERMIVEMLGCWWDWAWFSKMVRVHPIVGSYTWATRHPGSWSICFLCSFFVLCICMCCSFACTVLMKAVVAQTLT